jgi:hypothetical protein
MLGAPGIRMHAKCGALAWEMLMSRRMSRAEALTLACYPFDSVRYIEFETIWQWFHSRDVLQKFSRNI